MRIDRHEVVNRHNPVLRKLEYKSPLTVGNGNFAFTADVTGLQTLYDEYEKNLFPLSTMSQWGWHTKPVSSGKYAYTMDDLHMTEYTYTNRKVSYAVDKKVGNEEVYSWLRENPHRFNLGRLGLLYDGKRIKAEDLTDIKQTLYLYEGILDSQFKLKNTYCRVQTSCHQENDTLAIKIESELLSKGHLTVDLLFPYGSSDISGSDWKSPDNHTTTLKQNYKEVLIERTMDQTKYDVSLLFACDYSIEKIKKHNYHIRSRKNELSFTMSFIDKTSYLEESINHRLRKKISNPQNTEETFENSRTMWTSFWKTTGIVDMHNSKDPRAKELERRIILSLYQSRVQSCGPLPPQETGLTCNSWHGKFHLEMYLWHMAYLPLWNHSDLIEPSLDWYLEILPKAKENAARNGFKGAKWPKQVAYDGIDSPSPIATLLIWQQPHIIYIVEMLYQAANNKADCNKRKNILDKYWPLIKETADYMVDLAVYNESTGRYNLPPPVIPAQEAHEAEITVNPIFEVEYWRFTLSLAVKWAKRLDKEDESPQWKMVSEKMADLAEANGLYLAHENCPSTYEEFNKDHPMMVGAYGLIPSDRVDKDVMLNTLRKVLKTWDFDTMWGWDFAMMAMTATRLGYPDLAIDLLLMDTPNNQYVASGNNSQKKREDLPVYLPGNGSILLALAIMLAGHSESKTTSPGFPKDGSWNVSYENINPFPY